jgi:glycerol-3-phosphate dehydrogenase (NAD(P)+)
MMRTVTVLGAGSWGTALAVHLGRIGHDVRLWARDRALVEDMIAHRANAVYLPDVRLPDSVSVTDALPDALADAELVVAAIPSHGCRAVVHHAAPYLAERAVIVSATKGLEAGLLLRMSQVVAQEAGPGHPVVVLSGPSFALEVARELPTAVLAASSSPAAIELVQQEFRGPYFRLYGSDDVIGVEIGAAMKNIIAIAAGVVEGLGLGHNALAALITRGLAELTRLACAAGGRRETLAGLSGLGDLVLTCTGSLSRNRHVGVELGRGRTLSDILASMKMVAEGVITTGAALELGTRYGVELPITAQMAEVLSGRTDVRTALDALMLRKQRAEAETGPLGGGVAG